MNDINNKYSEKEKNEIISKTIEDILESLKYEYPNEQLKLDGMIKYLKKLVSDKEKLEKLFEDDWFLINGSTLKTDINDDCLTIDNIKEFNKYKTEENN